MEPESPESRTPDRAACAWEDFVSRTRRPLAGAVRRELSRFGRRPQPQIVDETLQDVYFRLFECGVEPRRFLGRHEPEVRQYLRRVVHSVVVDGRRRSDAVKRGGRCRTSGSLWLDPADPAASPEERLLRKERRRLFLVRCAGLVGAARQRNLRIAALALLGGWTSREIAATCGGLNPSTIDSIVYRVRRRLFEGGAAQSGRLGRLARI